jgi:TolB-like protein/Tfp pilus assembly protein PilF
MSFLQELRRRNVIKVAGVYLATSWLILQLVSVISAPLYIPLVFSTTLTILLGVGFPFACIFAWAFELTPDGIMRTTDVAPEHSIAHATGRKIDFIIIGILSLAIIILLFERFSDFSITSTNDKTIITKNESQLIEANNIQQPTIAVLPFVNMSSDPEQEYFSDGITEEILNLLAKIPKMRVTGRTSSFAFKGINQDLREIGKKLGVEHILEGSVRKQGNKIRITAQLIQTKDGIHLWSETYDRNLDDIFVVQDEIASKIANELQVSLLGGALSPQQNDISAEAHNFYLLGLQRKSKNEYQALLDAKDYFAKAIALSPNYIDAHFAYAEVHCNLQDFGIINSQEATKVINQSIATLDKMGAGDLPRVKVLQSILDMFAGKLNHAQEKISQALYAAPNDLMVIFYAALIGVENSDEFTTPIALLERAQRLDPLNLDILLLLGQRHTTLRNFSQVEKYGELMRNLDPNYPLTYYMLSRNAKAKGDLVATTENALLAFSHDPMDREYAGLVADALINLGQVERANFYLKKAEQLAPDSPLVTLEKMLSLYAQGELKEAGKFASEILEGKQSDRFSARLRAGSIFFAYQLNSKQYAQLIDFFSHY